MSLSARRAWIEILLRATSSDLRLVALRKESVDRNIIGVDLCGIIVKSLSARRAWIEIELWSTVKLAITVALRKESVDRNYDVDDEGKYTGGRSPQGERG